MRMKVLIIEDEAIAAQRLVAMLREIDRDITVLSVIDSVEAGIAYFNKLEKPELIFMDIELGDGQSFQLFDHVTVESPIVFTTAYQEHTLKAFKLNSVDYLLKPINKNELTQAILKYKKIHTSQVTPPEVISLIKSMQAENVSISKERFLARLGTRLISTATDQIAYFYTKDKLQYIKTVKNEDLIIDKALDDIEEQVDKKLFFRANRQFIINYRNIERVHAWFSGKLKVQVTPLSYEDIIVSRLKAAEFKKWLGE